jgi:hypothetical protein
MALGVILLAATPALAGGVATSREAPTAAVDADDARIGCWVTAYGEGDRVSGALNLIGHFGSKCDSEQKLNPDPIGDDPVPPTVHTRIDAVVQYCSYTGRCKSYSADSGVEDMPPHRPAGFWHDAVEYVMVEGCKLVLRPPFDFLEPLCEVSIQHWRHQYHHSIGDYCYADCREGGTIRYSATHYISIPSGTGYHLEPGLVPWLEHTPNGGCRSVDLYNLVCTSLHEAKASSPPAVVLPPQVQEPVNRVKRECEDRMGQPACNP